MVTMQIEEARKQLGELVDRARFAGEPTMIMRYRKPAAVLVSIDWYHEAVSVLAADGPLPAQREASKP